MSEITKGDRIRRSGWSDIWDVIAVHKGTAWVRSLTGDEVLVPVSNLTKVEPRFEVGKKYTPVVPEYHHSGHPVTVTAVNDGWAMGWRADGDPWWRRHTTCPDWEEAE